MMRAQQALVGARPTRRAGPGSTTRYCFATAHRLGLVGDRRRRRRRSAPARRIGPTSSGRKTPSPPPSIIAGPPMPMFEFAVAITTSQQPSSAALPAKQRPELMPTSGTRPLRRAEVVERHAVEAGDAERVGVARAAAAALGEEARPAGASCSASSNMRSFLRWFCRPCVPASTV